MPSSRADSTMARPASSKRDCTAQTMDKKPMNMLNDVMRLGLGISFIYSVMFIGVMLLVDVLYGVIDPRIRLAKEE